MGSDSRDALKKGFHTLPPMWTWEWFTDVMDVDGGTQPPASTFISEPRDGYVRLVQIRDFESDSHLTFIPDSKKWRKCAVADVLIGRYGAALGRICTGLAGAYNVALAKVVPTDRIHVPFAYHLLSSSYFQVPLLAGGGRSAQAGFNKKGLAVIRLPIPPLSEQRAIAHILGTLDDKIELNRRRNQTLEAMARALFKDWFVDFGPVRAKIEGLEPYLPADHWQLFPDRLDDEGKPNGWAMVPASELITFNPTESLRKGTLAPYLDMASLPTSGSWPEPPILREFGSGMRFRNGDTLLARITPCLENGKTAFVQCLPDDAVGWGSTEYIVMRPRAPAPAAYAYLLARDGAFREHAIRSMTGTSGRQRAQGDSVAAFKLTSPADEKIWHAFARQVEPGFKSIKANAEASQALAQLRDTLLPKLISGELRIANSERILETHR